MALGLVDWAASQGFLPHGYCFQWNAGLLSLMVASDAVIVAAYFSIPLALLVLVQRRKDLHFNWVFVLFSAFIFLCGSTHLVDIVTVWWPQYWLQAWVKAGTALASAATAMVLWPLIPKAVRLPSTGELAATVRQLEHEVAERRAAEARLDQLTRELEQRVRERTHELEAANAERLRLKDADLARRLAEEANRSKTDFLSRMSHELRTPLNAILGFSQLMLIPHEQGGISDQHRPWARHIETAGHHLLSLIDDVLDIARIEAGKFEMSHDNVHLASALQECATMLGGAADERQIAMDLAADNDQTVVVTDGRRLRQVLSNLLSNAIKYNRPGGRVTARMGVVEGNRLHIEVADTGLGLSDTQCAQLFQPFNRLGREGDADVKVRGTGLGLAVVKQLVDALRGQIEVHSRPGEGTRFVIDMPV